MLLSPIPYVPSNKPEGPKFNLRSRQAGAKSTRLVFTTVLWMSGVSVAFLTALSIPGFWGQAVGKISWPSFRDCSSLTHLGCLLVMVHRPVLIG